MAKEMDYARTKGFETVVSEDFAMLADNVRLVMGVVLQDDVSPPRNYRLRCSVTELFASF